ncbi:PREDICTED: uncharacterized protein LOC106727682 [Myotis brandtii]|uniref:uncharacterized protein LOC106727682 n=1 Tax=Myotis brandtii TaxID=109478 RepID=UPI0007041141|nr:PREDICTED: uncharacterized protein LOC106727682 [Myotis brandtii]
MQPSYRAVTSPACNPEPAPRGTGAAKPPWPPFFLGTKGSISHQKNHPVPFQPEARRGRQDAKELRRELALFSRWENGGPRAKQFAFLVSCQNPGSPVPRPAVSSPATSKQAPAVSEQGHQTLQGTVVWGSRPQERTGHWQGQGTLEGRFQAAHKGERETHRLTESERSRGSPRGVRHMLHSPSLSWAPQRFQILQSEGQTLPGREMTPGFVAVSWDPGRGPPDGSHAPARMNLEQIAQSERSRPRKHTKESRASRSFRKAEGAGPASTAAETPGFLVSRREERQTLIPAGGGESSPGTADAGVHMVRVQLNTTRMMKRRGESLGRRRQIWGIR